MYDFYAILKVEPAASAAEIKAAFRRRAKEWHPDSNGHARATRHFQLINEAYETLKDPAKRAMYDFDLRRANEAAAAGRTARERAARARAEKERASREAEKEAREARERAARKRQEQERARKAKRAARKARVFAVLARCKAPALRTVGTVGIGGLILWAGLQFNGTAAPVAPPALAESATAVTALQQQMGGMREEIVRMREELATVRQALRVAVQDTANAGERQNAFATSLSLLQMEYAELKTRFSMAGKVDAALRVDMDRVRTALEEARQREASSRAARDAELEASRRRRDEPAVPVTRLRRGPGPDTYYIYRGW